MRIERFEDDGLEVYVSATEVWVGDRSWFVGAFKVGDPPGIIGGEFVKDANGKTQLFNTDLYALDAAKQLYQSKKHG